MIGEEREGLFGEAHIALMRAAAKGDKNAELVLQILTNTLLAQNTALKLEVQIEEHKIDILLMASGADPVYHQTDSAPKS